LVWINLNQIWKGYEEFWKQKRIKGKKKKKGKEKKSDRNGRSDPALNRPHGPTTNPEPFFLCSLWRVEPTCRLHRLRRLLPLSGNAAGDLGHLLPETTSSDPTPLSSPSPTPPLLSLPFTLSPIPSQHGEISRRNPQHQQASPDEFVAAGEPRASYSLPSLLFSSSTPPRLVFFVVSAAEQRIQPRPKVTRANAEFQPPFSSFSGHDWRRGSRSRVRLNVLHAVHPSSSFGSPWNVADDHRLAATSPEPRRNPNLIRWAPFSSVFDHPIWILWFRSNHLSEEVSVDLGCPILLKSDAPHCLSTWTGIALSDQATCRSLNQIEIKIEFRN
jgi:hypothetical protein